MKLATNSSGGWDHYDLEMPERIRRIAAAGFRHVDFHFWSMTDTSELMADTWQQHADAIGETCASSGVGLIQAHSPAGNPLSLTDPDAFRRRTVRAIECCGRLGIPQMVVHPGAYPGIARDEFMDSNRDYYRSLLPTAEETGTTLLIENIGTWQDPHFVHDGPELCAMVEHVDHPLVQACWDTGHGNVAQVDQHASITALGSHLRGLHVQDNAGPFDVEYLPARQDMHTMPFLGSTDFDALIRGLRDIDYAGYFTFEVNVPRTFARREVTDRTGQVRTIDWPSVEVCQKLYELLYLMGKEMLTAYDLFEE